jgi:tetratricopeptide (TPR) repeat protein
MHDGRPEIYDRVCFLLDEVEARLEEGFSEEALQLAQQAERLLERNPEWASGDLAIDAQYCLASCLFELRNTPEALRHYETVRLLDPADREIDYWHGRALFHSWRFVEAEQLLQRYQAPSATRAGTLYYRALLRDYLGSPDEADLLFGRAHREGPTEYPRPLRLEQQEVQQILNEVLYSLPADVQEALRGVSVKLVSLPDPSVHASPDIDPLTTSLYRSDDRLHVPAQSFGSRRPTGLIEVFQRNLELSAGDHDELREELRLSLLHQIGHHLGWHGHRPALSALN